MLYVGISSTLDSNSFVDHLNVRSTSSLELNCDGNLRFEGVRDDIFKVNTFDHSDF